MKTVEKKITDKKPLKEKVKGKAKYGRKNVSYKPTQLRSGTITIGESLEDKVRRITRNKEPIEGLGKPLYFDRKDGVVPATDIRTDRWEIATEAMDKVSGSIDAGRENRGKVIPLETDTDETNDGKNNAT